jgi:hypothetical protein
MTPPEQLAAEMAAIKDLASSQTGGNMSASAARLFTVGLLWSLDLCRSDLDLNEMELRLVRHICEFARIRSGQMK